MLAHFKSSNLTSVWSPLWEIDKALDTVWTSEVMDAKFKLLLMSKVSTLVGFKPSNELNCVSEM